VSLILIFLQLLEAKSCILIKQNALIDLMYGIWSLTSRELNPDIFFLLYVLRRAGAIWNQLRRCSQSPYREFFREKSDEVQNWESFTNVAPNLKTKAFPIPLKVSAAEVTCDLSLTSLAFSIYLTLLCRLPSCLRRQCNLVLR
jgi:hypothetical protein